MSTFYPQIFCQTCMCHMNKVSPKKIYTVCAYYRHLQKILGAVNVDLGLVSSGEARANQTQVNILPPQFFLALGACHMNKIIKVSMKLSQLNKTLLT